MEGSSKHADTFHPTKEGPSNGLFLRMDTHSRVIKSGGRAFYVSEMSSDVATPEAAANAVSVA